MSEHVFPNSIEGLRGQLASDCAEFDAARLDDLGDALHEPYIEHITGLLRELGAAVEKLKDDQKKFVGIAQDVHEVTELAAARIAYTTQGTNNAHAHELRRAAQQQERNTLSLLGEVKGMGGAGNADPLEVASNGVTAILAAVEGYRVNMVNAAISVEATRASRRRIHDHANEYGETL